jgi:hypothetical protein
MKTLAIAAIACAAVALPQAVRAATFTVNSTDDGVDTSVPGDGVCATPAHTCTLRAAIMETNALPGADTIIRPAGRYELRFPGANEDLGWKGDLDITDDLTITGAGEAVTIIDGNHIDRVFDVHSPAHVMFSGLTITNGEPAAVIDHAMDVRGDGGGLLNNGMISLTNVTFVRNRAGRGGGWAGAFKNLGTAMLTHVTFLQNRAGNGYCEYGGFDRTYRYCVASVDPGSVGAFWNVESALLTDAIFRGNRAGDATSDSDSDGGDAGGMLNDGDATLTDVTFRANRAGGGVNGGSVGGLENHGNVTLSNVAFSINRAGDGLTSTLYRDGGWGGRGGGMDNDGTARLTKVMFDRNRSGNGAFGGDGGGMLNRGNGALTDVSFVGNHLGFGGIDGGAGGNGGGLYNDYAAIATINNAAFDSNRAGDGHKVDGGQGADGGNGGGISDEGVMTLTNVTITRNRAGNTYGSYGYHQPGNGGGLFTPEATLTNVTLAYTRAGRTTHGSGYIGTGNQLDGESGVTVANTIVFGSGASCGCSGAFGVCKGSISSQGHNLDSGTTCGFTATGDLSNTDPRIEPLKLEVALPNHGGFTPTLALLPGSPAIDAGDSAACPATDQRGVARPQGAACDIGAYEFQP